MISGSTREFSLAQIDAGSHANFDIQTQHAPVDVGVGLYVVQRVATMNRRQKVLAPILDPSQRITQMPCDRRDRDLFGVYNVLDPEATAHVGRDQDRKSTRLNSSH